MITVEERFARTQEKMQQLERQWITKEKREQESKHKVDLRRKIIVGEIFINHFPVALEFTPCRTTAENSIEFAPLEDFISALAEHQNLLQRLEAELLSESHKR